MDKRSGAGEKKDDDEGFVPFQNLEKGVVLQEKRIFSETPLNPRKCCQLLTKILYLVNQGDRFTKTEATEAFFSVTRLFQSKDIPLRRMLYLVLKELSTVSDNVIIVISSLTKDMTSTTALYRANAIRVLTGITDNAMLSQVERHLKQSIVDKDPSISSAALVSGTHLMNTSAEIIKRWVNEVQESLQSKHSMVQYHALGLLHRIKQHDRLAVSKLVQTMTKSPIRSPLAHCILIRFTSQVMEEDPNSAERGFYSYLETCLRHKSDMVIYEAARAICNLKNVSARELTPAITMLQISLSSPKPAIRFAAVRCLNKVAQTHPLSVTTCNLDMENLITDSNRSIATLAITTLLKTGSESSVDRLMKQISNFMSEISDEFKIVVVDAIRTLCTKFPQKQRTLLNFLSSILRDEGGFEYKKATVEAILVIIKEIPEAKEAGLTHLCEFIEDCEFTYLSNKILHLLGKEGPSTSTPSRYIRYIYNRISLENASVRASAVSALAKFGIKSESLRPSIVTLLKRCLYDNDDEVRDRATLYLRLLEKDTDLALRYIGTDFVFPMINLERSLQEYQRNPSATPFDLSRVSITQVLAVTAPSKKDKAGGSQQASNSNSNSTGALNEPTNAADKQDHYAAVLAAMPQFAGLGPLFKSSKTIELSESETEYVVTAVKHTFNEHFVFQFNCTNTVNEMLLEKLSVKMDVSALAGSKVENLVPLASLPYGSPGTTYVSVRRAKDSFPTGATQNTLKFISKEVDPSSGEADETGYDDNYKLEEMDVTTSDYVRKTYIANWEEKWNEIGDDFEVMEQYSLSTMKSLQEAVQSVSNFLGMQACDRTDAVPAKKSKHILLLAGEFLGGIPALARARIRFVEGQGVQMELTVRSKNDDVSTALASSI